MIKAHLKYRFKAQSAKYIKDPFIQKLYQTVLCTLDEVDDHTILHLMNVLTNDKTKITVKDLGAGSKLRTSNQRQVKSILKHASTSGKYAKLLARLANVFHSQQIIELGTSLGFGTAYMASHNPQANVITIEGCNNICQIAKSNIKALGLNNVTLINNDFKTALVELKPLYKKPDFIYIDGDHTYDSTLSYFNFFKANSSIHAIIVFDDIKWSDGMIKAWDRIIQDSKVRLSIDMNRLGIVFMNPQLVKKHFILKF